METAAWFLVWTFGPTLTSALITSRSTSTGISLKTKIKRINRRKIMQQQRPKYKVFGVERAIDIPPAEFPSEQELEALNGDAMLPGHCHGWYESVHEQAQLHYRYFLPDAPPKAIIVFAHGICTHGGKALILPFSASSSNSSPNEEQTEQLRKLNMSLLSARCMEDHIALFCPDMYGHGYSEGVRFWIPHSYQTNIDDLHHFVSNIVVEKIQQHYRSISSLSSIPLFLMGESYGGCLSLLLARQYQDSILETTPTPKKPIIMMRNPPSNFSGLVLLGPAIMADLPPAPVFFFLKHVLAPLFPQWRPFFMPNPLPPERIWSDPRVVQARSRSSSKNHYSKTSAEMRIDGSGQPFRLGTAAHIVEALHDCEHKAIPGFSTRVVPLCIVHGVDDAGVPVRGSDYLWAQCCNTTITVATSTSDDNNDDPSYHHHRAYWRKEGAMHDILADPYAEEALDFVMQFIHKRTADDIESS